MVAVVGLDRVCQPGHTRASPGWLREMLRPGPHPREQVLVGRGGSQPQADPWVLAPSEAKLTWGPCLAASLQPSRWASLYLVWETGG